MSRSIFDLNGDGWCDLWDSVFEIPPTKVRNTNLDSDGDGLTDYEEMILMRDPFTAGPMPRVKSPGEVAADLAAREKIRNLRNPGNEKEFAALMLASQQTGILAEQTKDLKIPDHQKKEEDARGVAAALAGKAKKDRVILDAAMRNRTPEMIKKGLVPHYVTPSGEVEYSRSLSYSAEMVHADDLWPPPPPTPPDPQNPIFLGGLTGADVDGEGIPPLYPVGIWENDGGIKPADNPGFGNHIIFGNSSQNILDEGLEPNASHAVNVAKVAGWERQEVDGPQGIAYGSRFKIFTSINDFSEMMAEATVTGMEETYERMLFSNHSYGDEAGWAGSSNNWKWYGPSDPSLPTYSPVEDSPIYEDPEFGSYTARSKTLDHIVYHARTYLPVFAAGNQGGDVGRLPLGPNSVPYNVVTYPGGVETLTPDTTPHALDSGIPAGDAPNPQSVDNHIFEYTLSPGLGFDTIPSVPSSKNILTVGAAYAKVGGVVTADDMTIRHFSSRGPTDDGRIKPDLVGPSQFLVPTGLNELMWGTSFAAPAVTGTLALLNELNVKNGGPTYLSSSWKALLLNTAIDGKRIDHLKRIDDFTGDAVFVNTPGILGPSVESADLTGPDFFYGWGMLNAKAAADLLLENLKSASGRAHLSEHVLYDPTFDTNDTNNLTIEIPVEYDGVSPEIKVMICWTDPPYQVNPIEGMSESVMNPEVGPYDEPTSRLMNDLNLSVIDPATEEQLPWVMNPLDHLAKVVPGVNKVDNVEQVVIPKPVAGTYLIKVTHKGRLKSSSHLDPLIEGGELRSQLNNDRMQAFSLAISGNRVPALRRPGIEEFQLLGYNNRAFRVEGIVGVRYQIEVSSDLTTWSNAGPSFFATGPITISPSLWISSDPHLFYRAREISTQ